MVGVARGGGVARGVGVARRVGAAPQMGGLASQSVGAWTEQKAEGGEFALRLTVQ